MNLVVPVYGVQQLAEGNKNKFTSKQVQLIYDKTAEAVLSTGNDCRSEIKPQVTVLTFSDYSS